MSIFSKIQKTKLPSNTFDLSHDRKFSGKMGNLIPINLIDCVPGDKISINSSAMVRFSPLIAPVMHQVSVYIHYFFVPNRILWANWEKFISGGEDGFDSSVFPTLFHQLKDTAGKSGEGTLADYLGLPVESDIVGTAPDIGYSVSALPFAVYQMIWDEYYRDQNLQEGLNYSANSLLRDGDNSYVQFYSLRKRAWQHDYFTSALPWAQKGPEAMLPLGNEAPISSYSWNGTRDFTQRVYMRDTGDESEGELYNEFGGAGLQTIAGTVYTDSYLDLGDTHFADLSSATASSINDLRRAFKLQEWLEKNARGGSRYIESIAVHFGVQSSDGRLQRPEYLGGSSSPLKVSEVLQMSSTDSTSPQGSMAGHALAVGSNGWVSKYCEEHGYIIGLMSVMPKTAYQQGIPRHFTKFDKFDYYWPEFAHIGEQPIHNKELFLDGSDLDSWDETFGYTPRYSEYKYMNSSVHGQYRSSLDFWHMGRKFDTVPALNEEFITMNSSPIDQRIFAVSDGSDNLWCHVHNKVKASRLMPVFGTPKM